MQLPRHQFGYPEEPTPYNYQVKHYELEQYVKRHITPVDGYYSSPHICVDDVVNMLVQPVSKLGRCKETLEKTYVVDKLPSTLLDHLKHILPDSLKFGWLTPKYTEVRKVIHTTNIYDKVEHYHRAIISKDFGKTIRYVESNGSFSDTYHRVALYGKTPEELRYNLFMLMEVMMNNNGRRVSLIRLTPKDWRSFLDMSYGFNTYNEPGKDNIFGVPVVVEHELSFSVVEA